MVSAGMDVARLNLSQGALDDHLEVLGRVRSAAADADRPVAVMADLPGPKVRLTAVPTEVVVVPGQEVRLRPGAAGDPPSDDATLVVAHAPLLAELRVGDTVS